MVEIIPSLQIHLRRVIDEDLDTFFEHQLVPEANWVAAFTAKVPKYRRSFDAHW